MKLLIVGQTFMTYDPIHSYWMGIALEEAKKAAIQNEVPVGAVLTCDNEEIARGHNQSMQSHDPTAHAEIVVLRKAANQLQNYRLPNTSLYITLEPCMMCAGAIFSARISTVFFGTKEPKTGCVVSVMNAFDNKSLNHHCKIEGGILEQECAKILQ